MFTCSIEDEEVIEEHEAQMRRLHEEQEEEEGYCSWDEEDEDEEEEEEQKWARVQKEQDDEGYHSIEYDLFLLCNPQLARSISELAKLFE